MDELHGDAQTADRISQEQGQSFSLRVALAEVSAVGKLVQHQHDVKGYYRFYQVRKIGEPDRVILEINGMVTLHCTLEQMERLLQRHMDVLHGWFPEGHEHESAPTPRWASVNCQRILLAKLRATSKSYRSMADQLKDLHQKWLMLQQQDIAIEQLRARETEILRSEQALLSEIEPLQHLCYALLSEQRSLSQAISNAT